MSRSLQILDSVSRPGDPQRINEDRLGGNDQCAFVIDGATGLGPPIFAPPPASDAAWLAEHARRAFAEIGPGDSPVEAARSVMADVMARLRMSPEAAELPRWQFPSAAFSLVHLAFNRAHAYGLGDCVITCVDGDGRHFDHSGEDATRERETGEARALLERIGGLSAFGRLRGDPSIIAKLRENRARQNRGDLDDTVWTLGPVAEAADHISHALIDLEPPFTGLVMSDGFAALSDLYGAYDRPGLIAAAHDKGLAALLAECEDIERDDPEGHRFPRYKPSDDASAILFRIA